MPELPANRRVLTLLCQTLSLDAGEGFNIELHGCTGAAAKQAAATAPLLRVAAGALQQLAVQYMPLHKATAKLGYVASSLFVGLLEEGFCTAEDSTEEAVGGEGGTFKEAEGTVSPLSPAVDHAFPPYV